MTTDLYETRCMVLFDAIFNGGVTDVEVRDELSTWDIDDIRALALSSRQLYQVSRAAWFRKATENDT